MYYIIAITVIVIKGYDCVILMHYITAITVMEIKGHDCVILMHYITAISVLTIKGWVVSTFFLGIFYCSSAFLDSQTMT